MLFLYIYNSFSFLLFFRLIFFASFLFFMTPFFLLLLFFFFPLVFCNMKVHIIIIVQNFLNIMQLKTIFKRRKFVTRKKNNARSVFLKIYDKENGNSSCVQLFFYINFSLNNYFIEADDVILKRKYIIRYMFLKAHPVIH